MVPWYVVLMLCLISGSLGECLGWRLGYPSGKRDAKAELEIREAAQKSNTMSASPMVAECSPEPLTIFCDGCHHTFDPRFAQEVLSECQDHSFLSGFSSRLLRYCPACEKPYDEVTYHHPHGFSQYYKHIPANKKRVNQDGSDYVELTISIVAENAPTEKPKNAVH